MKIVKSEEGYEGKTYHIGKFLNRAILVMLIFLTICAGGAIVWIW